MVVIIITNRDGDAGETPEETEVNPDINSNRVWEANRPEEWLWLIRVEMEELSNKEDIRTPNNKEGTMLATTIIMEVEEELVLGQMDHRKRTIQLLITTTTALHTTCRVTFLKLL